MSSDEESGGPIVREMTIDELLAEQDEAEQDPQYKAAEAQVLPLNLVQIAALHPAQNSECLEPSSSPHAGHHCRAIA